VCVLCPFPQIYTYWLVSFAAGTTVVSLAWHDCPSTLLKCLHMCQTLQTVVFKTGLYCSISLSTSIFSIRWPITFPRIQVFGDVMLCHPVSGAQYCECTVCLLHIQCRE
jgi:hypothetical protein